jgi:hypothetical protein
MRVSVVRDRTGDPERLTIHTDRRRSQLVHETHLGAGVHLGVDVLAPRRWLSLSVDGLDELSKPLVSSLVGHQVADSLRTCHDGTELDIDTPATPWMRVAMVDGIDRWLHLPLDQSVVDAERGVSRLLAAATLPAGSPAYRAVIGDALRIARRASAGLVAHLRRLARAGSPVPARLRAAIDQLVEGYVGLAATVAGPDRELAAVPAAWRALRDRVHPSVTGSVPQPRRSKRVDRRSGAVRSNLLDPRQIPARVLAMSADPGAAEVRLVSTASGDEVRIEVSAFGPTVDEDLARRLQVRLLDRRTSDPLRCGILTVAPSRSAARRFQCILPADGLDLDEVRADVYDSRSRVPPAIADSDAGLREARRAAVFFGEWRRLVATAWLSAPGGDPAIRARELADRISRSAGGPGAAAFGGVPTADELIGMIEPDDDVTADRLRVADDPEPAWGSLGSAAEPGRMLVAELASASEESH